MTGKYGTPNRHPESDGADQHPKTPINPSIPNTRDRLLTQPVPPAPKRQTATTQLVTRLENQVATLPRWIPRNWQFWSIMLLVGVIGVGTYSAAQLFFLPDAPNCPAIFLPTASASMRLYCAQMLADKRNVEDLLKAIALVDSLPSDHPLRPEINRNINNWSDEILKLSEETFQNGNLTKAIETAKRIPANTTAHQAVEKQIKSWQTTWAKAEKIYHDAEADMSRNDLRQAFLTATRLLSVGNTYWETTKYQQLSQLITDTRVDGGKLDKAKGMLEDGSLESVQAALKLVGEIKPQSHLYKEATGFIGEAGTKAIGFSQCCARSP